MLSYFRANFHKKIVRMFNFSWFIAHRVAKSGEKSVARLIVRIATAAVALSMTVMILAICLVKGFKAEISAKVFGFWGHIHIVHLSSKINNEPSPIRTDSLLLRGGALAQQIHHLQPYATKAGIIKTEQNFEGIILKGIGANFHWDFVEKSLLEGKRLTLNSDTTTPPSPEILVSQSTANRMQLQVGQKFVVHFVKDNAQTQRLFQVAGIYKTGLEEYDRQFALVDIRQVQELLGWSAQEAAGIEVFVNNLSQLEEINNQIYEYLPRELTSQTIKEEQPNIFQWLELQDLNEEIILTLMLIVSLINMTTALLILILERTNMIGTLKALGSSNWQVQKIFLVYGIYIVFGGLTIGNILGLGLAFVQKQFGIIRLSEADYYLNVAPIRFDFIYIAGLNICVLLLTALVLLLPSLLILRITPIKAIRFK
jgi:lipoprotein-releasing system permease protein